MTNPTNITPEGTFHRFSFQGFPVHMKEYAPGSTELPLVFIGGAFQNITAVEKLSNAFSQETWVITVDTPGNGETGVLPHEYDFEFICQAIHHGLCELGVSERVNMLGCSYGSIIAMRYAQMFNNIEHLVLGSAMDRMPDRLEYAFNHLLFLLEWDKTEEFANSFTDLMTNPQLREKNRLARLTADKLRHALLNANCGIKEQFKHNTKRILDHANTDLSKMPLDMDVTVFTGEHDHFLPVEANMKIADTFENGRFISLPNADHMFHVEQFRPTVRTILDSIKPVYERTLAA